MNKRFRPLKMLPVWAAIAAVFIVAGIVLFALLGFNYSAEHSQQKTIAIDYNFVVEQTEREDELKELCKEVLDGQKLSYTEHDPVNKQENFADTGDKQLVYSFKSNTTREALDSACAALKTKLEEFRGTEQTLVINVSVHEYEAHTFGDAAWRGAIAIAVGAVVALIYIGIRFGIGSALTGLVACVSDVFCTLGILAITRLPLYTASPLLLAAIAAFCSLLLWMIQCAKMRENFKDPAFGTLSALEAVEESQKTSWKFVTIVAGMLGAVVLVAGAVASAGLRLMVLPALIPVLLSVYSSLLLAPALHVYVKAAFDKVTNKRKQKYVGKKKAEKTDTVSE